MFLARSLMMQNLQKSRKRLKPNTAKEEQRGEEELRTMLATETSPCVQIEEEEEESCLMDFRFQRVSSVWAGSAQKALICGIESVNKSGTKIEAPQRNPEHELLDAARSETSSRSRTRPCDPEVRRCFSVVLL